MYFVSAVSLPLVHSFLCTRSVITYHGHLITFCSSLFRIASFLLLHARTTLSSLSFYALGLSCVIPRTDSILTQLFDVIVDRVFAAPSEQCMLDSFIAPPFNGVAEGTSNE